MICKRVYSGNGKGREKKSYYDRSIGCKSHNVVYGIWCEGCRKVVYVGETGVSLYARAQNHLSSIRSVNPSVGLPVRRHFMTQEHSLDDLRVVGLERVWKGSVDYRRARERRWMSLMGTDGNGGLNVRSGQWK